MKISVLDFETGCSEANSACAVGIVNIVDGEIAERKSFLIRPPQGYVYFTEIHGITWNMVKRKPTFQELIPKFNQLLEGADYIGAHNAGFDRRVLLHSYAEAGQVPPILPAICTVKLARRAWNLNPAKLPDIARHLGINLQHHDAMSDADACAAAIMRALSEGFPIDDAILNKPSYTVKVRGHCPSSEHLSQFECFMM